MIMKKIFLFAFVLLALVSQAQNKMGVIYDDNVQVRKLPNFTSIRISNAIELYISQSNKTEVAVSAKTDEYRNRIITEVVGGTLIIRMADNNKWWKWNDDDYKTKAYVSVKELYALTGSGATNIKIVNGLSAEKLKINLSGASDLKGDIKAGTLAHKIYGTTSISERHRHRYEYNSAYLDQLQKAGLLASGTNPQTGLVEIVEIEDHPFFIGVQYHPEYKSTVANPHPIFVNFVAAAVKAKKK
jgi:hypothetical protein